LPTAEAHVDSEARVTAEHAGAFSPMMEIRAEYSQPAAVQGVGAAGDTTVPSGEAALPAGAGASPEAVQGHLVGEDRAPGLAASHLGSPVAQGAAGMRSADSPVGEEDGKYQLQEEKQNFAIKEHPELLHGAGITETQQLEKVFVPNVVPIRHPHS
ncbi:hypothetical protein N309_04347, partial [Tinamus guttatus]